MKRLLIGVVASGATALGASVASADGMPDYTPAPRVELPIWSGFYFGAGLGYGHGVSKDTYSETDGTDVFSSSFDGEGMNGGLGTVIIGFDRQFHGKFVAGAFADFDWSDIRLTYSEFDSDPGAIFPFIDDELKHEWSWAVGGRVGYLFTPATLLYFTGGYTQAHFKSDGWYDIYTSVGGVGVILPGKDSVTYDGYFVGFGMETLLGHNFFLRGELRYADYGSEVINTGELLGVTWVDKEDLSLLTGRIGLTYKIGHGERVVTPIK